MNCLLVVVNERDEFIFKYEFSPAHTPGSPLAKGGDAASPLPMLLAYAALDTAAPERYNGWTAHKYACIAGHKLVLVVSDFKINSRRFFTGVEAALSNELMLVYTDDRDWLGEGFVRDICDVYRRSVE